MIRKVHSFLIVHKRAGPGLCLILHSGTKQTIDDYAKDGVPGAV